MAGFDPFELALAEIAFGEDAPSKDDIVEELMKDGILLPQQDWGEEFQAKAEAITVDWFERHPECVRGSGQFAEMFPDEDKAEITLSRMSEKGRITPDEYLVLYREIMNF